jgi:hypothetical protein
MCAMYFESMPRLQHFENIVNMPSNFIQFTFLLPLLIYYISSDLKYDFYRNFKKNIHNLQSLISFYKLIFLLVLFRTFKLL